MNIEVIALCDAAIQSGGKLSILGAFDTIGLPQVPAVHPQCAIALRIRFSPIEDGSHRVKINIADEDGNLVVPSIEGNVSIKPRRGQGSVTANLIFNIQRLKLDKYGQYSIDVAVDGRQEASLPLFVKELKKSAQPSVETSRG